MYAQYIAAQAFNSGGLGIIHSISHAVSAFYDTHHGLNNAIALPRVWAFNMPVAYQRFADIAEAMGIDTHGMTKVQAAEAALAAGIRLLRDVGIPERFIDVKQDSYSKNRLGQGPTKFYENAPEIIGRRGGRRPHHQPRPRRRLHARQRQGVHVRDRPAGRGSLHQRRPGRPAVLTQRRRSVEAVRIGRGPRPRCARLE